MNVGLQECSTSHKNIQHEKDMNYISKPGGIRLMQVRLQS